MYTDLKMGIKRIVVCNNKLNLYRTELSRKKSVNIKKNGKRTGKIRNEFRRKENGSDKRDIC